MGDGGAITMQLAFLVSINNVFINNFTKTYGGCISMLGNGSGGFFFNNSMIYNTAGVGSVLTLAHPAGTDYFVTISHNSILKNQTIEANGGAIRGLTGKIYSYNSIYVANEEAGTITQAGQIRGTILGGDNLIENGTTITRETVFGNNEFKDGHIKPLAFAKSAKRLTENDIVAPDGLSASEIIS